MAYALSAFSAANTKLNLTRKAAIQPSEGLRRFTVRTEGSSDEDESDKSNSTKIAAVVALGALGLYFMQRSR
jgi:hypothetical protein